MASFDELKSNGNECFKNKQFELALQLYSKALDVSPNNHVILSNRSLTFYKLERYDAALSEANQCITANKGWAKGYIRKATALNALGKHKEAKEACVVGFALQDQSLCNFFVEEWLKASRALVDPKFDALKKPPWSDVLDESADFFCDEYCNLLYRVSYLRLSDAESMSHETMTECVFGAVKIADDILKEFHFPPTVALKQWAEVATIQFESFPKSEWGKMMENLHEKSSSVIGWFKNDLHEALNQILHPVLTLALLPLLVRGNVLCQAYTGHHSIEYFGFACVGFFEQNVLADPKYTTFHMGVLSLILNSYRLRGALNESELELIRGLCHKLENLLSRLSKDHKQYKLITEHYQHTVKLFREICAKVITDFKGSYDPTEALSELEIAMLKCDRDPDAAMDVALKYLTDIASKTKKSETSSVSHINFIDAENMLYITGILAKLGSYDRAVSVFHSGESMVLSLLATILERNILSLDNLPSTINNCRKLALSGALCLKDHCPKDAADVFIRWKSLFTELRATLIRLGLRDCYREAFQAIEQYAVKGDENGRHKVRHEFQAQESHFFRTLSLHAIRALYRQDYDSVAQVLQKSDVVIDYTFKIYNPEHHNPPQSQACVVVISPQGPPTIISISDNLVYDLLNQWPKAIYKLWQSQYSEFEQVTKSLSDVLFPEAVRKILLDPMVTRVFICPDSDLMCFPIDQLPLNNEDGTSLPLYERFSVSILSSPRELLRDETVKKLRKLSQPSTTNTQQTSCDEGTTPIPVENEQPKIELGQHDSARSELDNSNKQEGTSNDVNNTLITEGVADLQLTESNYDCFIVANPDYKLECTGEPIPSWKQWLGSFSALLGYTEQSEGHTVQELNCSQAEAESVCHLLEMNPRFKVHPPISRKEATISTILSLKSPHLLHFATHGYSSKQESIPYRGNFWTDESSGILLAGAQTYLDRKFDKMDVKAGTGHMNSIAMCGMQLEETRFVFVSACDSSVGSRPSQEMPASITHALRAAGAQTVISTLWPITDSEAAEFVLHFYEHLLTRPNCRPSEALSFAKGAMKKKGHSMFYWGAYVCHGLDEAL